MNSFLSTLILLAGLTEASSGTASSINYPASTSRDAQTAQQLPEQAMVFQQLQQQLTSEQVGAGTHRFIGEPFLPEQAQENVLVVPMPDLPAESLADLTEDMTVMCRIFDKSLTPTRASTGFAYGSQGDVFRFAAGQQTRGTQGLYLDGYGALFFVHVDYPLLPMEPQEPSQAKAKESADTVWSATVKEMSGQPGEDQQAARSAQTYDPQKVENLKKAAIKTFAHASNIRMRRPQDVVTLVVGALDDDRASDYRRSSTARFGTSATSPVRPGTGKSQPAARNSAAALLVLRVTKADVDAFAKGQLTPAQFTEKVQSLWSPTDQGALATPTTATTPMNSRR